ncbi:serine hydrolase domain-containing protein [Pedobacter duraquae]|uniref:CubicO group peptidase (Beta-lactamase class C family) n=1 Tax=Pedobacter duraquae TaxID=425511 RepID=A0A4R6IKK2_9SPHI|nr:serine hydrolase domain-containing protein [Pedobacter duraquae]TDO22610.1 CubicO group peptidase (beta-lactamase class C family) [Pedobacter duraquae]
MKKRYLFLFLLLQLVTDAANGQPLLKKRVDALFRGTVDKNTPGYAIAILKQNKILYAGGYGSANLDYKIPITVHSAFDIASVSKQFTAACIALLIIDGKLALNMPVSDFVPEIAKYEDTIRIMHLIYNTSGIIDYPKLPRPGGTSWITFNYFTVDDAIRVSLIPDTLAFKPGTRWDYSNTNYMLLTKVVEKICGIPFSEFARKRLFEPLGMLHTSINDDNTEVIPNRVTPYNPRSKAYVDAYRKEGIKVKYGKGWIQHVRNAPHYGGSGVNTTVTDLLKWEANFFSSYFGGEEFYRLMHQTHQFDNGRDNQAFGLYSGIFKGHVYWGWDGGDFGVSSQIIRFPKEMIAIIVLSNNGSGNAADRAMKIAGFLLK